MKRRLIVTAFVVGLLLPHCSPSSPPSSSDTADSLESDTAQEDAHGDTDVAASSDQGVVDSEPSDLELSNDTEPADLTNAADAAASYGWFTIGDGSLFKTLPKALKTPCKMPPNCLDVAIGPNNAGANAIIARDNDFLLGGYFEVGQDFRAWMGVVDCNGALVEEFKSTVPESSMMGLWRANGLLVMSASSGSKNMAYVKAHGAAGAQVFTKRFVAPGPNWLAFGGAAFGSAITMAGAFGDPADIGKNTAKWDGVAIRLSKINGSIIWTHRSEHVSAYHYATATADDGLIVAGLGASLGSGAIASIDAAGKTLWWKALDGNVAKGFPSMDFSPNGMAELSSGYTVVGRASGGPLSHDDAAYVTFDSAGIVSVWGGLPEPSGGDFVWQDDAKGIVALPNARAAYAANARPKSSNQVQKLPGTARIAIFKPPQSMNDKNELYEHVWFGSGKSELRRLIVGPWDGLVAVGSYLPDPTKPKRIWLVKASPGKLHYCQ